MIILLFGNTTISQAQEPEQVAKRVIVISLDGARPDAILQANTPAIHELAVRGAVSWQAQTIFPPATLPGHASMLTGLTVEEHGLNHNDSIYPCPVIASPTFLTKTQEAGYSTAMVVGKGQLCQFKQGDAVDYTFGREGDRSIVDRVLELIAGDTEVIFAHFPNPDYFGHSAGWMSATYLWEMGNTDRQIGRIMNALAERNLTAETLIILTADHGGHGMVHGTNIPEDMTIPWIIAGPGVTPGTDLGEIEINVMDTAATVLWVLDIPIPDDFAGRVVLEAFE